MSAVCAFLAGALCAASPTQGGEPIALVPGRAELVALGAAREFVTTADFSGGLYVRTWSEALDVLLELEASGQTQTARDGGPERGTALLAAVEPGTVVRVRVAALAPGAEGTLTLELVAAADTEATRAATALVRDAQREAQRLWIEGDPPGARAVLEEVIAEALAVPGAVRSQPLSLALYEIARVAHDFGLLRASAAAKELVAAHCDLALPADSFYRIVALHSLAATLIDLGEYGRGRPLLEEVLALRTRLLPEDHQDLQAARLDLGGVLALTGDHARALQLLEQTHAACARTLPRDHRLLQQTRTNLAGLLRDVGDLPRARALHEETLAIQERTSPAHDPWLQTLRLNLALVLTDLGDTTRARELEELVLETSRALPDEHPEVRGARRLLANRFLEAGDLEHALRLQEEALEISRRTLPADSPELAGAMADLAATIKSLDPQRSRALDEAALEIFTRALPREHPNLLKARSSLAERLRAGGELEPAIGVREEVVRTLAEIYAEDHPLLVGERCALALDLAARGDRSACAAEVRAIARGVEAAIRGWQLALSPREIEMQASRYDYAVAVVLSLAGGAGRFDPDPELERASAFLIENLRGVSLRSALAMRAAGADEETAKLAREARAASADLVRLARGGAGRDAIAAARGRREGAERELLRRACDQEASTTAARFDADALAACMQPGRALVGYFRHWPSLDPAEGGEVPSETRLAAHVFSADGKVARVDLGPRPAIAAAVQRWRESLTGGAGGRGLGLTRPASDVSELAAGAEVRRLVFDPLVPALGGARRIAVAAEDLLLAVPLDALPVDGEHAPGERLGDRLSIESHRTLWELARGERPAADGELLLLGGIEYDAEPEVLEVTGASDAGELAFVGAPAALRGGGASFAFLPGTAGEVRAIAALAPAGLTVRLLCERRASRSALTELAPRARFLHLATHGWFAPESVRSLEDRAAGERPRLTREQQVRGASPMVLCGLALAGANLPEGERLGVPGMITAEELSSLDLSRCELAVLSACDTSAGLMRAGQGVASLQKALHMAGARTVVTSLWEVPDEATRELMTDFYRRVWSEGSPKGRALWEAKRRLRDARDERGEPRYAPRDWAAWILTGEPE